MSFKTQPAFIHSGDWDAETDGHPAMKFMRDYTNQFDKGNASSLFGKLTTTDFVYKKATGETFAAGQKSFDQLVQDYSSFTSYHHEPYFLVCWEVKGGYEMTGNAYLYANLPGDGSAVKKLTDGQGKTWEMKLPAGFRFVYKKDGASFKLATTDITSDSGPVVLELLKRGVIKPADLGL